MMSNGKYLSLNSSLFRKYLYSTCRQAKAKDFLTKYEDHPSQHLKFSQLHLISFKIPDRFNVSD